MRCFTKTRNIVQVENIEIDLKSLLSITHRCVPGLCRKKHCCCSIYEIAVDRSEIDRVIGYMEEASKYTADLDSGGALENIFEEDGNGSFVVDTDEDGLCAFAYGDRKTGILCSLHSVAVDLQLPHYKTKPKSCVLWPLAISEDPPLQLSIAEDAFDFPCNSRRKNGGITLDPNIAQTIRDLFGIKVLNAIHKACTNTSK